MIGARVKQALRRAPVFCVQSEPRQRNPGKRVQQGRNGGAEVQYVLRQGMHQNRIELVLDLKDGETLE